ncbi:MAG: DUF45 domain-containing protein [Planctomycetes bacterium]|nr:DUF45 domain-containing protein [Planctomycetota bacterium]
MVNENDIAISELPPVTYTRSARAKYLRITVKPAQTITVTIPRKATKKQAKQFVQSKIDWIKKHLHRLEQQDKIERAPIPDIDLDKAQGRLFERMNHFAAKHDISYRQMTFRCQKTKWGSCSSKGNISLNINIAFLPEHLQDYLLLHELCHLHHMNHSKQFWAELNKMTDSRAKLLQKELRGHRMKLTPSKAV